MASLKGSQKSTKESPARIKKKSGDEDAKEEPIESGGRKGPKEVDGKKNGKIVEAKKKSPRKDRKKAEQETLDQDTPPQQPNVEAEEAAEVVPRHRLCASCNEISRRWPPPPFVDPNPRDPTLLYPGDVDPDFQPSRGDILMIHPGLHMGLADLHRELPKDGFVSCYDGSPIFQFSIGDLVLRMGSYVVESPIVDPAKSKEISKLRKGQKGATKKGDEEKKKGQQKGQKEDDKKKGSSKKGKGKKSGEDLKQEEKPEPCAYNPYEKLELYTCSGFITAEEQARLEVERLTLEAEKERLENEAKKKAFKGKKDKKTKENVKGDVKKKSQEGADKTKGKEVKKDGKKGSLKVPPLKLGKEEAIGQSPTSQDETLLEPGVVPEARPKPKWRYLGSQMQLDTKSQSFLGKQCPGLTYFYRRYMTAGTRCDMHSLIPLLGEILINIGWLNNWYKNLEKWQKEENNYKSLVKWSTPGLPSREELVPGMILLRPLVGREHDKWVGWGLDGKKLLAPSPPQPLILQEEEVSQLEDPNKVLREGEIVPLPKCDCHRKSPCPKPPCPCHLYDPCPKLPDCGCIYCNPLPRKPKPPPLEENPKEEDKVVKPGKGKGKNTKEKGKQGKDSTKNEASVKGVKKDANNTKQRDGKVKSKDGKDLKNPTKPLKGKDKDGKDLKTKEEKSKGEGNQPEELDMPKKPYVWGAVEMYLFYGEQEGWEYWGRSDRICDTPYPLPSESAKPKFLHIADRLKVLEEIMEEKIGTENQETLEVGKDSATEKPTQKNSKKVVKDGSKKQLQQEAIVKKNTKKT